MTIHKKGQAHWEGDIKRGKGTVSTESGVLNQQPYGFNTRFEGEKGTNPEELIGAAHAACFSMALSLMLGEAGFTPTSIDTTADVSLDKVDAGFAITKIALKSEVAVPGIDGLPVEIVKRCRMTRQARECLMRQHNHIRLRRDCSDMAMRCRCPTKRSGNHSI